MFPVHLLHQELGDFFLSIIPRARVGYEMIDSQRDSLSAELAIIIAYLTSTSGIIVF